MAETVVETASSAIAASKTAMYTGGGTSILAMLMQLDFLAIAGFILAILGFCINVHYQHKRHKREELESILRMQREQDKHEIEMKKLKGECNVKQD